ncbi:hypothetical protein ATZ33_13565 [Enterococcus silesiacus]|uniref:Uncharacterized protein n=1 Tax=Enterococcus silesiacus TaxID=332949 RepID=A0A0S3KDN0_9ENTE|nr:hypothetical protein [Enterococcus silesiacus]ALS02376.1 hypothetical protein ATZ33_13565 [Enterococcus silesiacus]OJG91351.1 hypothetical protein RV15_GL000807 [Enterococcus silesiacus]
MVQLTDEQYFGLSEKAYDNESLKIGSPIRLSDNTIWRVINSVDHSVSDLQGIAVVSDKEYQDMLSGKIKEYTNITFVSRGTSSAIDWEQNLSTLGIGFKPSEIKDANDSLANRVSNQFLGYENFVDETLRDNETKSYDFTGHSLGGALAQYMAVLKDKQAVTYASARAYRLLPKDYQVKVDTGYYDNKIVDYRHSWDPVGYIPKGKRIGKCFLVDSESLDVLIASHMTNTFRNIFRKDGAINVMFSPEFMRDTAGIHGLIGEEYQDMKRILLKYIDFEVDEIERMRSEIIGNEEFSELEHHEIEDVLKSIFPHGSGMNVSLIDESIAEELFQSIDTVSMKIEEKA